MDQNQITQFWETHPCGDALVATDYVDDYQTFFEAYDTYRYTVESHILRRLDAIDWRGKRVLEIGLGQGADSEQIIRRGGIWSGIDVTQEAADRTRTRLDLRGLPYERVMRADVTKLPDQLGKFDIVYSHGVLHHVPEIHRAQAEIWRVLEKEGRLVVMLYARRSLNYLVSIFLLRRAALVASFAATRLGWKPPGMVADHVRNAQQEGIVRYLSEPTWTSRNTDGPGNPYSKVYDLRRVRHDFPAFSVDEYHREFMHAPPLPVHRLPGGRALGWHLWLHMRPRAAGDSLSRLAADA
jgi:SAM-dependent methyltransferase